MRGKIRSRRYVNWNELVRDFELICSNAMKYNQKRSRVHKQVGCAGVVRRCRCGVAVLGQQGGSAWLWRLWVSAGWTRQARGVCMGGAAAAKHAWSCEL